MEKKVKIIHEIEEKRQSALKEPLSRYSFKTYWENDPHWAFGRSYIIEQFLISQDYILV